MNLESTTSPPTERLVSYKKPVRKYDFQELNDEDNNPKKSNLISQLRAFGYLPTSPEGSRFASYDSQGGRPYPKISRKELVGSYAEDETEVQHLSIQLSNPLFEESAFEAQFLIGESQSGEALLDSSKNESKLSSPLLVKSSSRDQSEPPKFFKPHPPDQKPRVQQYQQLQPALPHIPPLKVPASPTPSPQQSPRQPLISPSTSTSISTPSSQTKSSRSARYSTQYLQPLPLPPSASPRSSPTHSPRQQASSSTSTSPSLQVPALQNKSSPRYSVQYLQPLPQVPPSPGKQDRDGGKELTSFIQPRDEDKTKSLGADELEFIMQMERKMEMEAKIAAQNTLRRNITTTLESPHTDLKRGSIKLERSNSAQPQNFGSIRTQVRPTTKLPTPNGSMRSQRSVQPLNQSMPVIPAAREEPEGYFPSSFYHPPAGMSGLVRRQDGDDPVSWGPNNKAPSPVTPKLRLPDLDDSEKSLPVNRLSLSAGSIPLSELSPRTNPGASVGRRMQQSGKPYIEDKLNPYLDLNSCRIVHLAHWSSRPVKYSHTWDFLCEGNIKGTVNLIVNKDGYNLETGRADTTEFSNVELEVEDRYVPYYSNFFAMKEHENLLGFDENNNPIIISIDNSQGEKVKTIIWTKAEPQRVLLPSLKYKIEALTSFHPEWSECRFVRSIDGALTKSIIDFEAKMLMPRIKIGVLYAKQGQSNEDAWYNNDTMSDDFTNFLDFLATKIELKGWTNFRGGLNTKDLYTGTHSYYTQFDDFEVMFHVCTLIPRQPADIQQVERKRHLGNDIIMIIFRDADCTEPFDPSVIQSHFNHVFLVVQPVRKEGKEYLQLAFSSKKGVKAFGPVLPGIGLFEKTPELRSFLLTKLINAENGAVSGAPDFRLKMERTRAKCMTEIINRYWTPAKAKRLARM